MFSKVLFGFSKWQIIAKFLRGLGIIALKQQNEFFKYQT